MDEPLIREASHAGSWYTANKKLLNERIDKYMSDFYGESIDHIKEFDNSKNDIINEDGSYKGARVAIGPHAGHEYCGSILGQAYKSLDTSNIKRIFILGPSHYVYYKGFVLTSDCDYYETPIGNIPIDVDVIKELTDLDKKVFKRMKLEVDEKEHCFEMHLPFIYKKFGSNVKLIPIMISSSSEEFDDKIANYLKPYFQDKSNAFIVSTDFCHWGSRFSYEVYTPTGDLNDIVNIKKNQRIGRDSLPIYKSIESLDKAAIKSIITGSYRSFKDYIYCTENTICGAKPLGILMLLMQEFINGDNDKTKSLHTLRFNGYAQSFKVIEADDSSVSYASAYGIV